MNRIYRIKTNSNKRRKNASGIPRSGERSYTQFNIEKTMEYERTEDAESEEKKDRIYRIKEDVRPRK